jgi:predicted PurR-regulated permease PerM
VLQFIDPYFIKPRLFGNTLGVSGLLILISVIVCGRMFGVVGILISIPLAAILSFVYKEAILPELERRADRRRRDMVQ